MPEDKKQDLSEFDPNAFIAGEYDEVSETDSPTAEFDPNEFLAHDDSQPMVDSSLVTPPSDPSVEPSSIEPSMGAITSGISAGLSGVGEEVYDTAVHAGRGAQGVIQEFRENPLAPAEYGLETASDYVTTMARSMPVVSDLSENITAEVGGALTEQTPEQIRAELAASLKAKKERSPAAYKAGEVVGHIGGMAALPGTMAKGLGGISAGLGWSAADQVLKTGSVDPERLGTEAAVGLIPYGIGKSMKAIRPSTIEKLDRARLEEGQGAIGITTGTLAKEGRFELKGLTPRSLEQVEKLFESGKLGNPTQTISSIKNNLKPVLKEAEKNLRKVADSLPANQPMSVAENEARRKAIIDFFESKKEGLNYTKNKNQIKAIDEEIKDFPKGEDVSFRRIVAIKSTKQDIAKEASASATDKKISSMYRELEERLASSPAYEAAKKEVSTLKGAQDQLIDRSAQIRGTEENRKNFIVRNIKERTPILYAAGLNSIFTIAKSLPLSTLNTLSNAIQRGGERALPATHHLLMLSDKNYRDKYEEAERKKSKTRKPGEKVYSTEDE